MLKCNKCGNEAHDGLLGYKCDFGLCDGTFSKAPSDLDKFVELYKSLGINLIQGPEDDKIVIRLAEEGNFHSVENATTSDKFGGYCGFYSKLTFSKDGEFLEQGFWE